MQNIDSTSLALEKKKRISQKGAEYWMGRDMQDVLAYSSWQSFEKVIERAMKACESSGTPPNNHFIETSKKVPIGSNALVGRNDYFLSRYACYLIAMNGETTKPEIGYAQTYFAVQARRQELQDQLTDDQRRIQLRERVKDGVKKLNSAAKQAGVQKYGVFHNAGYRGLYEMDLPEIKKKKGIPDDEDLMNCAGRAELAANEFRVTQTEEKLKRENISTEKLAIEIHNKVGSEVRATIRTLGGTMPENLPAETSIKKLTSKRKKALPES